MLTPCIQICKIDKYTERCKGCGRTREQISKWSTYSDNTRKLIMEELDGYSMARSKVSTNKPMDDA